MDRLHMNLCVEMVYFALQIEFHSLFTITIISPSKIKWSSHIHGKYSVGPPAANHLGHVRSRGVLGDSLAWIARINRRAPLYVWPLPINSRMIGAKLITRVADSHSFGTDHSAMAWNEFHMLVSKSDLSAVFKTVVLDKIRRFSFYRRFRVSNTEPHVLCRVSGLFMTHNLPSAWLHRS